MYDKQNAEINGPSKCLIKQRVPEIILHALAVFGGWPGALIAQKTLRHKTIKQPFQKIFWLLVVVNVIVFTVFLYSLN
jgi:uncharacterized membrane protein YsdA (DUF1294 family)